MRERKKGRKKEKEEKNGTRLCFLTRTTTACIPLIMSRGLKKIKTNRKEKYVFDYDILYLFTQIATFSILLLSDFMECVFVVHDLKIILYSFSVHLNESAFYAEALYSHPCK